MKNREKPCVTFVMAVYNGAEYLRESISSMLDQTFQDFDCIIINDGSTDETAAILRELRDPRILVLRNQEKQGQAYSLNRGLDIAQGRYIARIDADDRAMPTRLEKQVAFLETHPEVGILGTGCAILDDSGTTIGEKRLPANDLDIRWMSLLMNPFLHPSVMLRHDVLRQHHLQYDPDLCATQDYDLWARLLKYTQGANLDELLTDYRRSDASITAQSRTLQLKNHNLVAFRTIQDALPKFQVSQEQVSRLREAFFGGGIDPYERKVQRVKLAPVYLDVLAAFVSYYSEHPEIQVLKQRETLKITLTGVRLALPSYWFPTITRAIRLYPGSMLPIFTYIIKKHIWKRGWRTVQHLMKKEQV